MNKHLAITTLLLLGATAACHAQTQQAADSQTGGFKLKLKHTSSYSGAPAHNPFWPIGWAKSETTQNQAEEVAVPITADKFEVTSISTGSSPLAVINGKTYGEGETIIALYGDQKIKILVVAINDGEVVLQYLDRKYTIPLKRPEFVHAPTSEQEPLSPKDNNILILH
ncbi:MAG TPA: hypothetical protein VG733_17090 [Chthoniobacteraceae bacterium]|nr:hypothetical protein [Chthoniobacteraceae bacterium]